VGAAVATGVGGRAAFAVGGKVATAPVVIEGWGGSVVRAPEQAESNSAPTRSRDNN